MKALVVYDSTYGNTAEIGESIGEALGTETKVIKATSASTADLEGVQLFIAGSPTYGGRPTKPMQRFIKDLPKDTLKGITIASFDTRATSGWVKIFGFAGNRIEKSLKSLGGVPVTKPEGFFVSGTKGPLVANERQRAGKWAKKILASL